MLLCAQPSRHSREGKIADEYGAIRRDSRDVARRNDVFLGNDALLRVKVVVHLLFTREPSKCATDLTFPRCIATDYDNTAATIRRPQVRARITRSGGCHSTGRHSVRARDKKTRLNPVCDAAADDVRRRPMSVLSAGSRPPATPSSGADDGPPV